MSLTRRHFLRLLGAAPALAPVAALAAKRERFPRYFAAADPPFADFLVVRADDADTVVSLRVSGGMARNHRVPCTVHQLEQSGAWKQITAAEAVALLKPERYIEADIAPNGTVSITRMRGYWLTPDGVFHPKGPKP